MSNPFKVVEDFEQALCEYTGAPYCVTTTSCTMALLLTVLYHRIYHPRLTACDLERVNDADDNPKYLRPVPYINIPKRTYVGVPMSIIHAGGRPAFRDEEWSGAYRLNPYPIWDSARRLRRYMYTSWSAWAGRELNTGFTPLQQDEMVCLSFHWSKTLGIEQGGAILLSNQMAAEWLRMARFDGRQQGVPPAEQNGWILGYHAYMSPETAAKGLMRLSLLKGDEPDLPNSDYPDLSQLEIFK